MFARRNGCFTRHAAAAAAFHALAVALCAGGPVALADDSPARATMPASVTARADANLEQAFWSCDYVGTMHGVHAAPVAFCSDVTQAVRQRKFGGNLEQMLEWWRQNKSAAHAAVELQLTRNRGR
jgi:hypothetical protein